MNRNILFVDDEQNVLDGIKRQLRKHFKVTTALGADGGMEELRGEKTFAVIISDMRMPGKDGCQFLSAVQKICPNSTRMMLTGNADQQTAIDAVNKGNIFRFLNKPCETEALINNLEAGVRQYELVTAEKKLLEETLRGSIKVLVDILALSNPAAFSRAERIKYYVSRVAKALGLEDIWQYEVAALLSQIGYVTIPTEIMEKHFSGDQLTEEEQNMLSNHASEACTLLENIPRLENVAKMIAIKEIVSPESNLNDIIKTGAQLLRLAKDFDLFISAGMQTHVAVQELKDNQRKYNADILKMIEKVRPPDVQQTVRLINIFELRVGMELAEDVRAGSTLIVTKGQVVNALMRKRLENFVQQKTIDDKIRVYIEEQVVE